MYVAAPAQASDYEYIYYSAPEGWGSISGDCPDGGGTPNSFAGPHYGPGDPPYGDGSLEMTATVGQLSGTGGGFNNFGNLTALQANVWETTGSKFAFEIDVVTDAGYRTLVWLPNPNDGAWAAVTVDFANTVWTIYETGTTNNLGTTTLNTYKAAWPAKVWYPKVVSYGCDGPSVVYLDALYVGAGVTVDRLYDFEAQPTAVTMSANKSTLTYGQKVTLSTHATQLGFDAQGTQVELWAKPAGRSWTKIATKQADSSGMATATRTPKVTTTYKWVFPSYGANSPSESVTKKIGVKAKVTAELRDDTLNRGQHPVMVGKATPDKGGVTAKLWRASALGPVRLGSATVHGDGTYLIVGEEISTSGSATWKLYVTVPAEGGNLAGRSPDVSARIN